MGHYDSCFEADEAFERRKESKNVNAEFKKLIDKLSTEDKQLLLRIAHNIDNWRGFIEVIKIVNEL